MEHPPRPPGADVADNAEGMPVTCWLAGAEQTPEALAVLQHSAEEPDGRL